METRKFDMGVEIRAREDGEREFVISTGGLDRHGTVINPGGWILDNFRANPVMPYQHRSGSNDPDDILGTWEIRVEGDKLVGVPKFEPSDINPKAEKVRRKVEHGTLRAVSVGFIPKEWHWGVRKAGEDPDTLYLDKNELLEVSIVAIPSNPESLSRSAEDLRTALPKPEPEPEPVNDKGRYAARLSFIKNIQK